MQIQVDVPRKPISDFCHRWKVAELSVFGSVLRDDFRSDSDVDLLVSFKPDASPTLFDMVYMQKELESIFGRKVDLVSRRGVESSRNQIRRQAIMDSAMVIYGS